MDVDSRFWDKLAPSYAQKPFPNPQATARRMEMVRGLCRPDSAVLDVGCGTGTLLLSLAPHIARGEGVDLSPAMIEIARRKAGEAGAGNIGFVAAPAGGLTGVPDAHFDGVMAFNILHLVPDPEALLAAVYRVLRPGGWFVSNTACLGGIWMPPYPLLLPVLRWMGRAPPVVLLEASQLTEAVRRVGFQGVEAPDVGGSATELFLVAQRP